MSVRTLHIAYDDVSVGLIPYGAQTVGVYVDGIYANEATARARFPHAQLVTITVTGRPGARFCDCENGDLTPGQAAAWAAGEIRAGRLLPGIYSSVSEWPQVIAELARYGLQRGHVVVWSAHYTNVAHLCSPQTCAYPGFAWVANGTQFTETAQGRSLDESLVDDVFLGERPKPPDPHHYERFPTGPFRVGGRKLNERATVELYDRLIVRPRLNAIRLRRVRADLVLLRKRIWWVAHADQAGQGRGEFGVPPPTWDLFHRGWRWQELLRRTR